MIDCPCESGANYGECCEPVISGARPAETAEKLMRARYASYVRGEMDFLFGSTHQDHRKGYDHKGTREWAESAEWLGLEIVGTVKGEAGDNVGEVEFIARFRDKGGEHEHHENASFVKEEGIWFFTDGRMVKSKPLSVAKIGRNEPCPCGSGLKYKKCCGK